LRANRDRESPVLPDGGYADWFRPGNFEYVACYDLASNRDAAAFCLAHYDLERDQIVFDLLIEIQAPEGGEISFAALREITYALWDRGFSIVLVVADTWQSLETKQEFVNRGFEFEFVSVQRTRGPYETLLDVLVEDKLDFYPHAKFQREFSELIDTGRMIDHPSGPGASKDVADVAAMACYVIRGRFSGVPNVS
jgi:hypothetical protein